MKRILITIGALLFAAAGAMAQGPVKLGTLAPKGTVFEQELLSMKQKWQAAGVRLDIYPGGVLGGEAEMVQRMRIGQLQAAMLTVTGLAYIDESVSAIQNMPMMFRSVEELEYVREKLRPEFEEKFRSAGFVVLFWGDGGWVRFFSTEPGLMPEDFKRLKLWSWAGNSAATRLWRTAGFQPIELEVTDILLGLNTRRIQVVPSEPSYALAGQFYTKAPHMLELKWAPLVGATVMTAKSFDALKPAQQQGILAAAQEAGKRITTESRKNSEDAIRVMQQKQGLKVRVLTPEAEAAWRKSVEEGYPKIRGSIVPAEMFDRVVSLLDEYRKTNPQAPK